MKNDTSLEALHREMSATCTSTLKTSATNAVLGTGDAAARIVFVGEAPGKKESEEGRPFIGASGKMLDRLLESVHIKREDVYITNIVKFRPPDNRDPSSTEIFDCLPWLIAEINLIAPELIVPLGRHALEQFVPGQKISQAHGKLFQPSTPEFGHQKIYAMYHPAAAMYNGSLRETLFQDFARIPKILTSCNHSHPLVT